MMPKTRPCEGTVVAPAVARKLCRACLAVFRYSPLHAYPDYCPACVHRTLRPRDAASGVLSAGRLAVDEVEPSPIQQIAGAQSAEG